LIAPFLNGFTLVVTDECNFHCRYCIQKKRGGPMDLQIVGKALDLFHPFFKPGCSLSFSGGEPLLAFPSIRSIVKRIEIAEANSRKGITYSLSTNGSLLDDEVLGFLDHHHFTLLLSFDGLAQEMNGRGTTPGQMETVISRLRKTEHIGWFTHSVFTRESIHLLADSMVYLGEIGVRKATFSLDLKSVWESDDLRQFTEQVRGLRQRLAGGKKHHESFEILNFSGHSSLNGMTCSAGKDRLAVSADGRIWGCQAPAAHAGNGSGFPEVSAYCLGDVYEMSPRSMGDPMDRRKEMEAMQMDLLFAPDAPCTSCRHLIHCDLCPYELSLLMRKWGTIPAWVCEIARISDREYH